MNVEEFREYCLSLPEVTEATPFERFSKGKFFAERSGKAERTILGRPVLTVVFYVNSHMFCYFNVDDFSNITIKCELSEIAELKEHYQAVSEAFNGDKRYWISVQPNMDIHDEELKELVRKSYEIVKAVYKREKSDACISSSERKQARPKAKAKYRKHG